MYVVILTCSRIKPSAMHTFVLQKHFVQKTFVLQKTIFLSGDLSWDPRIHSTLESCRLNIGFLKNIYLNRAPDIRQNNVNFFINGKEYNGETLL